MKLDVISPALLRDLTRIEELWGTAITRFGGPYLAGPRFCAWTRSSRRLPSFATYGPPVGPEARRYAAQLLALPSLVEWYSAALTETWRDQPHEAEARAVGRWTADHRAGS